MDVSMETILSETIDRLATPVGLVLAVAFAVVGVLQSVALEALSLSTVARLFGGSEPSNPQPGDFAAATDPTGVQQFLTGLGVVPAIALWIGASVASLALLVVAIDGFSRGVDDPRDLGTDRLAWKTVNLVAGWILYAVLVALGTLFFIFPGLLIAIVLLFYPMAIVTDGEWVASAFQRSVELFQDNVATSFVAALVILAAYVFRSIVTQVLTIVAFSPVDILLTEAVGAVYWVFVFAFLTRTYVAATDDVDSSDVIGEGVDRHGRQLG